MSAPVEWTWRGTRVIFGDGVVAEIAAHMEALVGDSDTAVTIGLFTGGSAMRRQGILAQVVDSLDAMGTVVTFDGLRPNPEPSQVDAAADFIRERKPGAVIALGGGSVIDAVKVANCAAGSDSDALSLLRRERPTRARLAARFVAIPTTAGTGSEVTPFATIWDTDGGRKLSLDTPLNLPDLSLLDARITVGMPPALTAQTAADALGHAIESLWSRRRSPLSEALSFAALERLRRALPVVHGAPGDLAARSLMLEGSALAGMAISLTRTAAAHAISYGITLRHDVPHGLAVACLLPSLLRVCLPALPEHVTASLVAALTSFADDIQRSGHAETAVPETAIPGTAEHGSPIGMSSPSGSLDTLGDRLAESLQGTLGYYAMLPAPDAVSWSADEIATLAAVSDVPGRLDNSVTVPDREQIVTMLTALHGEISAASPASRPR